MFDIVSLGELLVDFTPYELSEGGNPCFERNPGGGPANMICAASRLGAKTAFLAQVGDDMFGQALKKIVEKEHVDCSQVRLSHEYKTTLAFVGLTNEGERSFSFYRQYGADTMMKTVDYDLNVINQSKYFFLSSVLMAEGTSRKTSFDMLEYAKENQVPVVFDPNLRFNLWADTNELVSCVTDTLKYANIVKVSDEELTYLMESDKDIKAENLDEAARAMREQYNIGILLVTCGKDGCVAYTDKGIIKHEGFKVDKPVDTTAAGDSFTGGFLSKLVSLNKDYKDCSLEEIKQCMEVGNAVGSITVTRRGAISALPTKEEVDTFLNNSNFAF